MSIISPIDYGRLRQISLEAAGKAKNIIRRTVTSPMANTIYYLPEDGFIDAKEIAGFLVYTPDGDPLTMEVDMSDGEETRVLAGYSISPSDYVVGMWNSIVVTEAGGLYLLRLKVMTGSTPPSYIKIAAVII
jgi:hypothetical protein